MNDPALKLTRDDIRALDGLNLSGPRVSPWIDSWRMPHLRDLGYVRRCAGWNAASRHAEWQWSITDAGRAALRTWRLSRNPSLAPDPAAHRSG